MAGYSPFHNSYLNNYKSSSRISPSPSSSFLPTASFSSSNSLNRPSSFDRSNLTRSLTSLTPSPSLYRTQSTRSERRPSKTQPIRSLGSGSSGSAGFGRGLNSSASFSNLSNFSGSFDLGYDASMRSPASQRKRSVDEGTRQKSTASPGAYRRSPSPSASFGSSDSLNYERLCHELEQERENLRYMFRLKESEWNRERRHFQRKISELQEEARVLNEMMNTNEQLKQKNGTLLRVISKLSK